jgi:NCAIR mutase (PurE)-related protein
MADDILMDWDRHDRIGLDEAVLCGDKSVAQLAEILSQAAARDQRLLLTRIDRATVDALPAELAGRLDYEPVSRTAVLGAPKGKPLLPGQPVAVISAGSSDAPVAGEAVRTLGYYGIDAFAYADAGVAGLWRILRVADDLQRFRVVIAVAGMEGALFSVVAGLTPAAIIAVPASTGYGVAEHGRAALSSALASCAPGIVTVNIDNGYGAACAAVRMLRAGLADTD